MMLHNQKNSIFLHYICIKSLCYSLLKEGENEKDSTKNKKLLVTHVIICAIAALIQVGVALVYSLITEVAMSGNIQKLMVVGLFAFFYILLNTMSDFVPRRSKSILVHSITDQLRVGLSQKIVRMDPEKFLKSEKIITFQS
ncbi:hypothetical protein OM428_16500 [Enterococcus gallinarum]|nr:hypothetical protein [Enterococcus gallinarum]